MRSRFFLTCLISFLLSSHAFSQNPDSISFEIIVPDSLDYAHADTGVARRWFIEAARIDDYKKLNGAIQKLEAARRVYARVLGNETKEAADAYFEIADALDGLYQFDNAIEFWFRALKIQITLNGEKSLVVAHCYNNIGVSYMSKYNFEEALKFYSIALKIRLSLLDSPHIDIGISYSNLGIIYEFRGDFKRSIDNYSQALENYRNSKHGYALRSFLGTQMNIGKLYSNFGEHEKAISYYLKCLKGCMSSLKDDDIITIYTYHNLGDAYRELGDFKSALENHNKALSLRLKKFGEMHPEICFSINSLANIELGQCNYSEAICYQEKNLEIQLTLSGKESLDYGESLINLGNTNLAMNKPELAIDYFKRGIPIFKKVFRDEGIYNTALYKNLGLAFLKLNDFHHALACFDTALIALKYENSNSLQKINQLSELSQILVNLANYYKNTYKYTQIGNNLYKSRNLFKESLGAINRFEELINPLSKLGVSKTISNIYEGALQTNHLLYTLTDSIQYQYESFDFAERSRAALLSEGLRESNALHISGIPDSLLTQEYNLRVDIAYYDKRRQELLNDGKSETDTIVLTVASRLFDLNQTYEALRHRFETEYPDYYRLKYDNRTISLSEVQHNLLSPNQSMLEYFVGDSVVYVFAIRPDTFTIQEIKKDFPLESWVEQLRFGLAGYFSLPIGDPLRTELRKDSAQAAYISAATNLYQKLVAPVEPLLREEVIVVPDGVLGYVPFETLLTDKPPTNVNYYNQYPYWLQKHRVRYTYSATLLQEMVAKEHHPIKPFAAFAPYYDGDTTVLAYVDDIGLSQSVSRDDVQPLKFSGPEVFTAQKLMGGDVFTDTLATEDRFNQIAGDYGIVHLSTHGKADDRVGDYAYLMFSPIKDSIENELLYCRDIYNLSLRANMVVLSACETGLGKLRRGEGIISLARAFAFAGAKSIVNSLWSVNDASTQLLVVDFYKGIKAGMPKSEALTLAKRRFLIRPETGSKRDTSWRLFRHPYYWSGFILIGDDTPLFSSKL